METPSSSSRRITRSQALAMATNNNTIPITSWKNEEFEKGVSKSIQKTGKIEERERSALIDITNDSPIVGLAIGNLRTPLSSRCSNNNNKKRMVIQNSQSRRATSSPGSGEALLRGQAKTLLQKVEEEAVISKISLESRVFSIRSQEGFVNSPMCLFLAPTPANTPQVSENVNYPLEESLGVFQDSERFDFSQILDQEEENGETEEKSLITRLLFTDPIEKFQESEDDDDDASLWSVQVNASTSDELEIVQEFGELYGNDKELGENCEYDDEEFGGNYEDDDEELGESYEDEEGVDELCEGLSKIFVNGGVKFSGKHKRFVYDSDGELEAEEEAFESTSSTPKGTHLRFV